MRTLRTLGLFALLFGFWQLLSGRLDPLFLVLGLLSAGAVTWLSTGLLEGVLGPADETERLDLLQLASYLVWLITRVPPAGFAVARVVLDPRLPPRPGVVRFRTTLSSPTARTFLANSITLVPGTMTLEVLDDEFVVHAFTPDAVSDLATAATQGRIARVFRLPPDEPPEMTWEPITAVREGGAS
jgi:multicomponent Na+:H+ antiporter subunit E